ncbi:TetR/AcrR family transcriptional regulator [Streptomyces hoynatensis]|uniref:TetR/AcrR family transcriptional regulator n=1 Tax=Streptomyces hoynatensis TaxID=1141874 RepID=A0A3A9YTX5_9ACTN|nr:TetR/AcrR family transcriptional regulator [Streptomyces hoynatensis]RKN39522.1 TetR/AcrR family transcriptional regulator [Streptomyces hoynatensis]
MPRTTPSATRRRLARGEQRIAQLLDAAEREFVEVGYHAATTNGIAARAGASPGTLYQFFPNKEAMAQALADRYLEELSRVYSFVHDPDLALLPAEELVERTVEPVVAFTAANPGFKAIFAGAATPPHLAASTQRLHSALHGWMDALLAAFRPGLPAEVRQVKATVALGIVRAMVPLIYAARGAERRTLVTEMKGVMRAYFASLPTE